MKCESKGCGNDAAFFMHWPGKSSSVCLTCLSRAQGVAQALGFVLTATLLEQP